jgi:hypothetical protein
VTVILPPVGSARSAILLLECIEKYFGHPIFARLGKEKRNQWWRRSSDRPGILAEMRALLQHYRAELLAESGRLLQEGAT